MITKLFFILSMLAVMTNAESQPIFRPCHTGGVGFQMAPSVQFSNDNKNATYKVKFIYIIPSDKNIRDNYEPLFQRISERLLDFFEGHLGQTLTYVDKILDIYRSPYTEFDILNGTYARGKGLLDDGIFSERKNLAKNLIYIMDDNYFYERYEQKMLIIGVTEITKWLAVGGAGFVSLGGEELDKILEFENAGYPIVYPFDHEVGHALGLLHTNNTIQCLRDLDILWDYQYTFINEFPDTEEIINGQPMAKFEKTLLLDSEYVGKTCLGLQFDRPHPSNYFSEMGCNNGPDIDDNGFVNVDDLASLLVNWGPCSNTDSSSSTNYCIQDIDCNGIVNVDDLATLLVNWGKLKWFGKD